MMFKKSYLSLLLFTPSLAFAHGIPTQAMVVILVVWPTIITAVYGLLVLLLRWKQLFKYQWITILSYIISIGALGLLALSIWAGIEAAFSTDGKNYYSEHYIQLFFLFLVILLQIGIVSWLFKTPIKQYRQLTEKTDETASSINQALGIKIKGKQ